MRAGYAIAVVAAVIASFYLALYVDEDARLRIWPWLWIGLTTGIGVTHLRLGAESPDRSFSLQAWLLCLAFTLLFGTLLVPRDPEWIQNLLGGLMAVPLIALVWVRRKERRARPAGVHMSNDAGAGN